MQSSLPHELVTILTSATAADYVTVGPAGRPTVWPARASYHEGDGCIDLGAEHGVDEATDDPHVAVLFAQAAPLVLVQGTARPETQRIRVRPERVLSWPRADPEAEPALFDTHLEEVRSGHNEEPEVPHAPPEGGGDTWEPRLDDLPSAATLGFVGPDGFPFAVRVAVHADRSAHVVRIEQDPVGAPIEPGMACLGAPAVCVHGDLADERGSWVLHPHRVTRAG
jgi:hypothetical protein